MQNVFVFYVINCAHTLTHTYLPISLLYHCHKGANAVISLVDLSCLTKKHQQL